MVALVIMQVMAHSLGISAWLMKCLARFQRNYCDERSLIAQQMAMLMWTWGLEP